MNKIYFSLFAKSKKEFFSNRFRVTRLLKKAKVILMCGLPGNGKSTVAESLSKRLGMTLLSSDKIREEIFKSVRYDLRGDLSVMDLRPKYYGQLFEEAKKKILKGAKLIIDASNMDKERLNLLNKIGTLINKREIMIMVVKSPKRTIAERMKSIKGMANEKEDFLSAWKRIYGYYEKHLSEGKYFWPNQEEGVTILEYCND